MTALHSQEREGKKVRHCFLQKLIKTFFPNKFLTIVVIATSAIMVLSAVIPVGGISAFGIISNTPLNPPDAPTSSMSFLM